MSELKARTARSIADAEEMLELGADCPIEPAQVYLKSEADKVIAENEIEFANLKEDALNTDNARKNGCNSPRSRLWKSVTTSTSGAWRWQFLKNHYEKWYNQWLKLAYKFKWGV